MAEDKQRKRYGARKREGEKTVKSRKTMGMFIRRLKVFTCVAPKDSQVFVAGSFNQWNPQAKRLLWSEKVQAFTGRIYLMPGEYEYKFVINGDWVLDPSNPATRDNGMNSENNILTL